MSKTNGSVAYILWPEELTTKHPVLTGKAPKKREKDEQDQTNMLMGEIFYPNALPLFRVSVSSYISYICRHIHIHIDMCIYINMLMGEIFYPNALPLFRVSMFSYNTQTYSHTHRYMYIYTYVYIHAYILYTFLFIKQTCLWGRYFMQMLYLCLG
jgi:hypothetical protein